MITQGVVFEFHEAKDESKHLFLVVGIMLSGEDYSLVAKGQQLKACNIYEFNTKGPGLLNKILHNCHIHGYLGCITF